jgi:hypothetical protein
MLLLKLMYDLQSYLGKMSAGLVSNNKIMQSKYGKKKRQKKAKLWQSPKVQPFLFALKEDDLP